MDNFNIAVSRWLQDQQNALGKDNVLQREVFKMILDGDPYDWTEDQQVVMRFILKQYMSLSFIIKDSPKKLKKLIEYLEPEE